MSWSLDAIGVDPEHATDAGHRTPRSFRLRAPGVELLLVGLAQVVDGAYQPGREAHFLDALGQLPR